MMYLWLLLGFILLIKGADYFVEASSSIARLLHIPGIIIGLTIVAFGTSAPELAVSLSASLSGNNDIAVSNVIGSNIFNLLVVLGACAAACPFCVKLRWDYAAAAAAAAILFFMIAWDHDVSRFDGIFLLLLFSAFMAATIRDAFLNRTSPCEKDKKLSPLRSLIYVLGGLGAIVWGGNLVVDSASAIAASFGLSQNLIGLTIVAVGTSLPELFTSVAASRKGESGLALGNVIGSNLFNILMILGLSSTISPMAVNALSVLDTLFLLAATAVVWLICRSKNRISRLKGAGMLLMYAGYLIYIILR